MAFLYPESGTQEPTNTQCMSCYDYNQRRCEEKPQQCYKGEQCVHIIAELTNGKSWSFSSLTRLRLKQDSSAELRQKSWGWRKQRED